jgi:hypothetical protein
MQWNICAPLPAKKQIPKHAAETPGLTFCQKVKVQRSAGKILLTFMGFSRACLGT